MHLVCTQCDGIANNLVEKTASDSLAPQRFRHDDVIEINALPLPCAVLDEINGHANDHTLRLGNQTTENGLVAKSIALHVFNRIGHFLRSFLIKSQLANEGMHRLHILFHTFAHQNRHAGKSIAFTLRTGNNMKLHHRRIGTGKPVFIFHGLFGMNDNWQQFALKLAEQGFEVIPADLRNHGHSPHSGTHDYASMADDIMELLEDTGVSNPVLIGHSMGGKAVLKWAADHPEIDAKIISIDIAPWEYGFRHTAILQALEAVDPATLSNRKEAEVRMNAHISEPSVINFLLKNLYRAAEDKFKWRFNLEVLSREIREIGKPVWPEHPVTRPVLFVRGTKSDYLEPERWNEIKEHYPNAELVSIDGAGHWVHVDRPVELLETVTAFLK